MREQLAVARRLPPERVAQRIRVHLDQEQSGLAKEILCRGTGNLRGGGKMNKAVARVIGAAAINALPLGLVPGGNGADFIDLSHFSEFEQLWVTETFRTVSAAFLQLKSGPLQVAEGTVKAIAQLLRSRMVSAALGAGRCSKPGPKRVRSVPDRCPKCNARASSGPEQVA